MYELCPQHWGENPAAVRYLSTAGRLQYLASYTFSHEGLNYFYDLYLLHRDYGMLQLINISDSGMYDYGTQSLLELIRAVRRRPNVWHQAALDIFLDAVANQKIKLSIEDATCSCEKPGYFNCGVPGIIAHLDNGKVASWCPVEPCLVCNRYTPADARHVLAEKQLL